MEANVILSKCSIHNKAFGIRIEKRKVGLIKTDWVRTWAFKIDESKAKREGYDTTPISGSLVETDDFPGCPYCESIHGVVCACGKLSCITPGSKSAMCYWCNTKMDKLVIVEKVNVTGGGF